MSAALQSSIYITMQYSQDNTRVTYELATNEIEGHYTVKICSRKGAN